MKTWVTAAVLIVMLAAMTAVAGRPASAQDRLGRLVTIAGGPQIGVTVREVTKEDAEKAKIAQPVGVVIESVREGTPAATAGLRAGDIVIDYDGERVRSVRHFTRLVQESAPQRQVNVVVMRGTSRQTLNVVPNPADGQFSRFADDVREHVRVTPPQLPREFNFRVDPDALQRALPNVGASLGVTVSTLTDQLAAHLGVKEGALVMSVAENSAAAAAGIKAGDVITAIDGKPVTSGADVARAIRGSRDGDAVDIAVTRDRKQLMLKATIQGPSRGLRRSGLPV
jgi:serine protease Do